MPAQLPQELRAPDPRRVRDLQVGERAYVYASRMIVDAKGECYLDPDSALADRSEATVAVDRLADGYHVTVIVLTTWETFRATPSGWVPVESINIELDPELERRRTAMEKLLAPVQGRADGREPPPDQAIP